MVNPRTGRTFPGSKNLGGVGHEGTSFDREVLVQIQELLKRRRPPSQIRKHARFGEGTQAIPKIPTLKGKEQEVTKKRTKQKRLNNQMHGEGSEVDERSKLSSILKVGRRTKQLGPTRPRIEARMRRKTRHGVSRLKVCYGEIPI